MKKLLPLLFIYFSSMAFAVDFRISATGPAILSNNEINLALEFFHHENVYLDRFTITGILYYVNSGGERERIDDITGHFSNVKSFKYQDYNKGLSSREGNEAVTWLSNYMSERAASEEVYVSNYSYYQRRLIQNPDEMNFDRQIELEIIRVDSCRINRILYSDCLDHVKPMNDHSYTSDSMKITVRLP